MKKLRKQISAVDIENYKITSPCIKSIYFQNVQYNRNTIFANYYFLPSLNFIHRYQEMNGAYYLIDSFNLKDVYIIDYT